MIRGSGPKAKPKAAVYVEGRSPTLLYGVVLSE